LLDSHLQEIERRFEDSFFLNRKKNIIL